MNKKLERGESGLWFILVLVWLAGAIGWVMNIVAIVHMINDPITGMFILRCVGIVVPPLGAVLGFL